MRLDCFTSVHFLQIGDCGGGKKKKREILSYICQIWSTWTQACPVYRKSSMLFMWDELMSGSCIVTTESGAGESSRRRFNSGLADARTMRCAWSISLCSWRSQSNVTSAKLSASNHCRISLTSDVWCFP